MNDIDDTLPAVKELAELNEKIEAAIREYEEILRRSRMAYAPVLRRLARALRAKGLWTEADLADDAANRAAVGDEFEFDTVSAECILALFECEPEFDSPEWRQEVVAWLTFIGAAAAVEAVEEAYARKLPQPGMS